MNWRPAHPAFQALINALLREEVPLYVVGGVVRDHLLGKAAELTDLDIVVDAPALPLAQRAADRLGWAFYPLDDTRDVARLVFSASNNGPLVCDVARVRNFSIEADLRSRDFTINALALSLRQGGEAELIDVVGGRADLAARLLRRVAPLNLADDPVRLLRAVRLCTQFEFALEAETRDQITRIASTVKLASPERLRDELWKALSTPRPACAVEMLAELGLLVHLLPAVAAMQGVEQSPPHYLDVYEHTLQAMRCAAEIRAWVLASPAAAPAANAWQRALDSWRTDLRAQFSQPLAAGRTRGDWLVWHTLFHDVGKPATRSVEQDAAGQERIRFFGHEEAGARVATQRLTHLRFARHEVALANAVVESHMRPHHLHASFRGQEISRRARYRFFHSIGGNQFDSPAGVDVLLLALADYQATHRESPPPDWDEYLGHVSTLLAYAYEDQGPSDVRQRPLVDGHMLMRRLQLRPGRTVGVLLDRLLEAQAAGELASPEEALALAASWLKEEEG